MNDNVIPDFITILTVLVYSSSVFKVLITAKLSLSREISLHWLNNE